MSMTYKFLSFLTILFMLSSCSVTHKTQGGVALPEGTTMEEALSTAKAIVNSGFGAKIKKRFPSITKDQLNKMYINALVFKPVTGDRKPKVSLVVGVKYKKEFPYAGEMVDYGRELAREYVEEKYK